MNKNDMFYMYYDAIFANKDYSLEYNYIMKAFSKFSKGISKPLILDVGCGTGEHTIEFQRNGHNITGLDIDEKMIQTANSKFKDLDNIKFILGDILRKRFNKKFNLVFSYFFVVNYIEDIDYMRDFFIAIFKNIEEGGVFAFDLVNGNATSFSPPQKKSFKEKYKNIQIEGTMTPCYDSAYNKAEYHYQIDVIDNKKKNKIDYKMPQVYWNPLVIEQLIKKSGFREVYIYKYLSWDKKFTNQDYKLSFFCKK